LSSSSPRNPNTDPWISCLTLRALVLHCVSSSVGSAGMRKTQLCQSIVYRWSTQSLWRKTFDWVFWIPVEEFKANTDLKTLVLEKWFKGQKVCEGDFDLVWQEAMNSQKTLLIFDRYESLSDPSRDHFRELLKNYPKAHVLITSRPEERLDARVGEYSRFDIDSLTEEQVKTYLQKRLSNRDGSNLSVTVYLITFQCNHMNNRNKKFSMFY